MQRLRSLWWFLLTMVVILAGCPAQDAGTGTEHAGASMNETAEEYVRLVLSVGQHDGDYVDAYYGPSEWKTEVDATPVTLDEILQKARATRARVDATPVPDEEMSRLRRQYLLTQLGALVARVELLGDKRLSFDEESKALYDTVAPHNTEEHFQQMVQAFELARRSSVEFEKIAILHFYDEETATTIVQDAYGLLDQAIGQKEDLAEKLETKGLQYRLIRRIEMAGN